MRWVRVFAIAGSTSKRCKPMNVIDCKAISKHWRRIVKEKIAELGFHPGLAVILVGNDPASMTYVNNKKKACSEVGVHSEILYMSEESTTAEVISAVRRFAERDDINGVMVQLPLPKHIDANRVIDAIPAEKDVDALTPESMGRLMLGETTFAPCTPSGVVSILKCTVSSLAGLNVVIVGRSNIVGKPLAAMLTKENATVTLCRSKTEHLPEITKQADIVISAVGKPNFITANMIAHGTVVVDVGINRTDDGKLAGDVCFDEVKKIAGAITPVPGGVGIMTVTMLLNNTYIAALAQSQFKNRENKRSRL